MERLELITDDLHLQLWRVGLGCLGLDVWFPVERLTSAEAVPLDTVERQLSVEALRERQQGGGRMVTNLAEYRLSPSRRRTLLAHVKAAVPALADAPRMACRIWAMTQEGAAGYIGWHHAPPGAWFVWAEQPAQAWFLTADDAGRVQERHLPANADPEAWHGFVVAGHEWQAFRTTGKAVVVAVHRAGELLPPQGARARSRRSNAKLQLPDRVIRHESHDERRSAVLLELSRPGAEQLSNRAIARLAGVSHYLVGRIRQELAAK